MSKWIPGDSRRRLHTALEKSRTFESNLKEAQLVLISRNATVAIKGALHWDWESKLQPAPMLTPVFWFLAWSHFHVTSTFRATVNCDPTAVATNGPVFKLLTTKLLNYSDFITKKPWKFTLMPVDDVKCYTLDLEVSFFSTPPSTYKRRDVNVLKEQRMPKKPSIKIIQNLSITDQINILHPAVW